ncbi:MAG: hypothetical protein CL840_21595 [Crocinitomicaceae bacterium]|nr:hypothetical protein [Crocinitomicaceae bacterium]|tara:strand:- start:8840 stop:9445 length:606 start_codon:yes stop_codon:yes gene_type:complete
MNWIKRQIKKFREKSLFQKSIDLLFVGFIALILFPNGRVVVQRVLLHTGLFNANMEQVDRTPIHESDFNHLIFFDDQQVKHSLAEYKGQVIFLNFWATWCPPCRAEIPSLSNLYGKTHKKENLKFLFLSYETPEIVSAFKKDYETQLPFGYLVNTPEVLNPAGLPTTYIIDKQGRIAFSHTGLANWDSDQFYEQLESLIKE